MPQEPSNAPTPKPPRSRPQVLLQMLRQLAEIILAFVPVLLNLLKQVARLTVDLLKWLGQQWRLVLPKVRSVLPTALRQLPDLAITGAAVLLLVLLIWVPTSLLRPEPTPAVPAKLKQDGPPVQVAPNPKAERIAALQEKLSDVSSQYGENLVQAVQADFAQNRLTVNLGEAWKTLEPDQQTRLANDLFRRAQKLSFREFEMASLDGKTIARPAVVGTGMVVLSNL